MARVEPVFAGGFGVKLFPARNRNSARRASLLAFLNSLIERTLPAIDTDRAAGIAYSTVPADDRDSRPVRFSRPPEPPEPIRNARPSDAVPLRPPNRNPKISPRCALGRSTHPDVTTVTRNRNDGHLHAFSNSL